MILVLHEISKWHNFLRFDELFEFSQNILEVMRQPSEDRIISISGAQYSAEYPASFMLMTSMNQSVPLRGYYGHS